MHHELCSSDSQWGMGQGRASQGDVVHSCIETPYPHEITFHGRQPHLLSLRGGHFHLENQPRKEHDITEIGHPGEKVD